MNEKLLYEQIISEKLNTLPVPDMADAIWARIESQLDMDMPTNDGGGSNPPPPDAPAGSPNLLGHLGVSIGLIALLTFFYYNQKQKEDNLQPAISLPATRITNINNTSPKALPPDAVPYTAVEQNGINHSGEPQKEAQDSVVEQAVVAAPLPADSANASNELAAQTPPPVALPAVDTIPKKRSRGVPLTDGDYRIVPKKDSLP